jgi:uncharacterized DUF497 family protein
VKFDWDGNKARVNLAKHGFSFELASRVWDDPLHVIVPDRIELGEMRWHAIGEIAPHLIVVVVHTYPEDKETVRIIGARRATRAERKRYEQETP